MDLFFLKNDLNDGIRDFPVKGEICPEDEFPSTMNRGSCLRIMTGSPTPDSDCWVIPVEQVEETEGNVHVREIPEQNPVRKKGEGFQKGSKILPKNTLIRAYEAGLLIDSGNTHATFKKPQKILIQVTGSELDESNNTNGPVLEQLLSHSESRQSHRNYQPPG